MEARDLMQLRPYGLAALLLLGLPGRGTAQDEARPNIVFLLTDDQRWDTLGATGNAVIQTPHLDRLAAEGVTFRQAFVTTSICSISRASILSGQYARRHGIQDFLAPFSKPALALTYPGQLQASGYYTGFIGKWGVGAKRKEFLVAASAIFDDWSGFIDQGEYWHAEGCQFVTHSGVTGFRRSTCKCHGEEGEEVARPLHLTTRIIPDKVASFLEQRDIEKPFCLSISFKAPHGPVADWPPSSRELYAGVEMPLPATATEEDAARLPEFLATSQGNEMGRAMIADRSLDSEFQEHVRHYYRTISAIDDALGQIRELLDTHGVAESTVILFTSDNGAMLAAHGLWGKWLMYEESIRIPMVLLDPRLPAEQRGVTSDEMVLNIDIAPTLLELGGVTPPGQMQGQSFVPLLAEPAAPFRESWFYEHHYNPGGMVRIERSEGLRTRTMKYIRYIDQKPPYEELFDLAEDPGETRNLAGVAEFDKQLKRLRREYMRLRDDLTPAQRFGAGSPSKERSGRRKPK